MLSIPQVQWVTTKICLNFRPPKYRIFFIPNLDPPPSKFRLNIWLSKPLYLQQTTFSVWRFAFFTSMRFAMLKNLQPSPPWLLPSPQLPCCRCRRRRHPLPPSLLPSLPRCHHRHHHHRHRFFQCLCGIIVVLLLLLSPLPPPLLSPWPLPLPSLWPSPLLLLMSLSTHLFHLWLIVVWLWLFLCGTSHVEWL